MRKRPRDPAQLAKMIVDIATGEVDDKRPENTKNAAAAELGRKGGAARAKKLSSKERSAIAKRAATKRWG